jgi:spoIIIJ-associated protein
MDMEWVETTAKTVDAAREVALDQLGVAADEAEIEIIEEPRAGLFGRTRGEARLRARIKPTPARAKPERRRRSRGDKASGNGKQAKKSATQNKSTQDQSPQNQSNPDESKDESNDERQPVPAGRDDSAPKRAKQTRKQDTTMSNYDAHSDERELVSPEEVGDAAVAFMDGLTSAFGFTGSAALTVDGTELDVAVAGEGLGLLVGSGGRTLNAIQDLVRVAAQRRLGDHETRLRIDVAGYRERRSSALATFARSVADDVRSSGSARSMEPMNSADRKVIHDALNDEDGVESRSEGEDPNRRIVVVPID